MSINSLFELSRRSFRTLDAAMNVTGQNVANVETEGYVRRRITMQGAGPATGGVQTSVFQQTSFGTGVSVASFERVRDAVLEKSGWAASGTLGYATQQEQVLGTLEGLLPASGDGSLGSLLNGFWNAWSDLANNPTDSGVRLALRSSADALASGLNRLSGDISALEQQTKEGLASGVERTNSLLTEIASLNATSEEARAAGTPNYEAEDRRDLLVKQLSEMVPVRVSQESKGGYAISIGGTTVVQADKATLLEIDNTGGTPQVRFSGTSVAFRPDANAGQLGAMLDSLNTTFPNVRAELDQLARALVTDVNALHTARFDDTGAPLPDGPNFFHHSTDALGNEDGVTASTIRLSADVLASADVIAPPGTFTSDGREITQALAALRTQPLTGLGGSSAEHHAIDVATGIGAQVSQASARAAGQQAVVDHLGAMAEGVSKVSLEEEMTNMIKFQQAFAATARVLNTADEMMQTLLSI